MKLLQTHLAAFLILAAAANGVSAQTTANTQRSASPLAISADIGTTGVGGSLWITASPHFTFTAGYAWLDTDETRTVDSIDYDANIRLGNGQLFANWHPWAGSFHVSAGAVLANNSVAVTGKPGPGATYELDGVTYSAAQVGALTGRAEFSKSVVPYVGLGFAKSPGRSGFGFFADAGVMFSGSANATLSADGPLSSDPTFQAHLRQEEKDLNDEFSNFEVYPVLRVGFMFRF